MTDVGVLTEHPALTVRQVADLLGVTILYVREMIADGRLVGAKLNPDSPNSEYRIPRSALDPWLGPWRPLGVHTSADPEPAPPPPTEGGWSRETLRARAGLPPEHGGGSTTTHFDDLDRVETDTPTGTVKPTHPDQQKPREPVLNIGTTKTLQRPLPAPLAPGQADPRRPEAEHVVRSTVTPMPPPEPSVYEGEEPAPIDPSTFGAGPRA